MGLQAISESNKIFASVLSDGKLAVKVDEKTEGAIKRDYETPSGEKGSKWELYYKSLKGIITSIEFKDTDYGQFLNIEIDGIILSLNTEGNFAQDLMKKLPNVNLSQEVELAPYSLETQAGKTLKGITVYQGGEKLTSYFWNGEITINGMPNVAREISSTYKKDDWKIFFIQVKKFLIEYTQNKIIPKIIKLETKPIMPSDHLPPLDDYYDETGRMQKDEQYPDSDVEITSIPF